MTELDAFLKAIEADPADDALWLVFADWLEERGDPLSQEIRTVMESGAWARLQARIFRKLGRHAKRRAACDAIERVLPIFERHYPDESSLRELLTLARQAKPGLIARGVQGEVNEACETAHRDLSRNYALFLAAGMAAHAAMKLIDAPENAFEHAAFAAVADRFGAKVGSTPAERHRPEWIHAFQLEYRWQFARVLRYRLEPERGRA